MSETVPDPQPVRTRRFRFSMGNLLLVVTLACLATALLLTHRKLAQTERKLAQKELELAALQPLPVEEVARQFKKATTLGPISTTVRDVRYSSTDNAYRVRFSWVDATSGQKWSTDVKLTADGYGVYLGQIRNGPFIKPLGVKESFIVAVEAPSLFKQE